MCQYSAQEGLAHDWHLVHLGSRAVGGAGLVFVEASAVTAVLAQSLKDLGVDLIDVSSGGSVKQAKIPVGRNYQVPFAAAIREKVGMMTGAVGLITDPHQASEIITSGQADLIFIAREFLREPYWVLKAEQALGQDPHYAVRRHT
jgi:2,4-dienoyl-CoA reductase-like NADH-dependent reductase (Old Yellow Enzyme family)